jgi:hypothetical protein
MKYTERSQGNHRLAFHDPQCQGKLKKLYPVREE